MIRRYVEADIPRAAECDLRRRGIDSALRRAPRLFGELGINSPAKWYGVKPFHQYITSVPVLFSVQSNLGITLNGSNVSQWNDQSSNAYHFTQGTAANQPAYSAQATINGLPALTFDGSNDVLTNAASHASGATIWTWGVYRINSWVSGRILFGGAVGIWMGPSSPSVQQVISTGHNTVNPGAVGTWFRAAALFNNSTTDYLHAGATTTTGSSNGAVGAFTAASLGGTTTPSLWASCSIAAHLMTIGEPNSTEKAALDLAVRQKYGTSVAI